MSWWQQLQCPPAFLRMTRWCSLPLGRTPLSKRERINALSASGFMLPLLRGCGAARFENRKEGHQTESLPTTVRCLFGGGKLNLLDSACDSMPRIASVSDCCVFRSIVTAHSELT